MNHARSRNMDYQQNNGPTNQGAMEAHHTSSLHPRLAWMICYEETGSVQEVCRKFGISRKTFYKWLKRYKSSRGESASLADRSRRPHNFPRATPDENIKLLCKLKSETGFGQRRLKTQLQEKYNITISERTIWKILKRAEAGAGGFDRSSTGNSGTEFISPAV
jgi:transposase